RSSMWTGDPRACGVKRAAGPQASAPESSASARPDRGLMAPRADRDRVAADARNPLNMLDQPSTVRSAPPQSGGRPRLDFQEHLADLEASGLLGRTAPPIAHATHLPP